MTAADPLVLAITEPVTRETASALVSRVDRIAAGNRVVIDLTAIPDFDSEGAAAIAGLQERLGSDRVSIVGFRQATARLIGGDPEPDDVPRPPAPGSRPSPWVVRRLRAIAVVQIVGDEQATDGFEESVATAIASEAGIVVLDLRGASLTTDGLQAIAFASSTAAVRGQELLVVNVEDATAERLRRAGLSATTYVAPEPLA